MKKFYTYTAALMLVICLTSCTANSGNSDAPTATDSAAAAAASEVSPSASPTPEPRTLSVYLLYGDFIKTPMEAFGSQMRGVTVNVQSTHDIAQYNETVATEIMSGNAPDIMNVGDYNKYGERGLLADFKTLMANDPHFDATQYIGNVLKSAEDTNGLMYAFPYQFWYMGMVGSLICVNSSAPASILSDFMSRDRISFDDVIQSYAGLSGGTDLKILNNFYPAWYMGYVYPEYIDFAGKTCDLTNPGFIQTMKDLKQFQVADPNMVGNTHYMTEYFNVQDDSTTAKQYLYYADVGNNPQYLFPFDGNHFEHCIPMTDKEGNVWVSDLTLSIYNGSSNKELAWELIKYLTNFSVQCALSTDDGYPYPVTTDAFATAMKNRFDAYLVVAKSRENVWSGDADLSTLAQNALDAYNAINDMPMVNYGGFDSSIADIITTEFDNYISGATTAEQAAANMQNKVELYLNE